MGKLCVITGSEWGRQESNRKVRGEIRVQPPVSSHFHCYIERQQPAIVYHSEKCLKRRQADTGPSQDLPRLISHNKQCNHSFDDSLNLIPQSHVLWLPHCRETFVPTSCWLLPQLKHKNIVTGRLACWVFLNLHY